MVCEKLIRLLKMWRIGQVLEAMRASFSFSVRGRAWADEPARLAAPYPALALRKLRRYEYKPLVCVFSMLHSGTANVRRVSPVTA
jgi:hypothetical protein